MTQFAAIPTVYNGVQFRSRLEARWAAFFDLCGWQWEYEPFDLNGWIPDFMLRGAKTNTLVEVKPLDWNVPAVGKWPQESDISTYLKSFPDLQKIFEKSEHEVIVCGSSIPRNLDNNGGYGIPFAVFAVERWASYSHWPIYTYDTDVAVFKYDNKAQHADFQAAVNAYSDRISGEEYKAPEWIEAAKNTSAVLDALWKAAGNAVQWKGPRK